VAASRVHLRAHHPSDVLGGAAIGAMLGLVLRPVVNVVTPGSRRRPRRPAKGMGPEGYVLKKDYETIRRDVGLPLSLRPQRP
jgi:hypothetical protein